MNHAFTFNRHIGLSNLDKSMFLFMDDLKGKVGLVEARLIGARSLRAAFDVPPQRSMEIVKQWAKTEAARTAHGGE